MAEARFLRRRVSEGYGVDIVLISLGAVRQIPPIALHNTPYSPSVRPCIWQMRASAQKSVETAAFGGRKVRIAQGQIMNFGTTWVVECSFFALSNAAQTLFPTPTIAP